MIERRYQVFVSSTFEDLQEARQEVMQALLELDCIPAGMELFPAANEDQWTLIRKVIDDCDYYMVIVAGRYGSTDRNGISYTEKEYRYALESGKPIIAFLHKDTDSLSAKFVEKTPEGKEKLNKFRELCQKKMVKFWSDPVELGSVVSRSVVRLIKTQPAVGWVRADNVPTEGASREILKLKQENEDLRKKLADEKKKAPAEFEIFSSGTDLFEIECTFTSSPAGRRYDRQRWRDFFSVTWNDIFDYIAPLMIVEATQLEIKERMDEFCLKKRYSKIKSREQFQELHLDNFDILESSFETILVQLRTLRLIEVSQKQRSLKDKQTYWKLTDYGDFLLNTLRAIPKSESASA